MSVNNLLTPTLISICLLLQIGCSQKTILQDSYTQELLEYRSAHEKSKYIGPRAPLQEADLNKLRYFDINKSFVFDAEFVQIMDAKPFEMNTYSGETKPYRLYGSILFEYKGVKQELNVYQSLQSIQMPQYRDHLFLPFKDLTNDDETYGGGRYIDLKQSDIQNFKMTLDFNKSYNPWCAYSDGYSCPIPPNANHLDIAVMAGEKKFPK